ncbi:polysaccharide biosynthesis tyrosine autokinase [Kocuria rhizophila]|uniref:polysaccharide biosynthesis tyrosine autokinase n=1 Tax=Kocuria rhizophila TaxID=72000 RepID=UPI0032AF16E2
MTVIDFLRLTRANLLLLLATTLAGLLVAFGLATLQPKTYTSSSTGFVTTTGSNSLGDVLSGDAAAQSKANAYIPLISSRSVAEKISQDPSLGLAAEDVAGHLSASVVPNSALIKVDATADEPEKSATLANSALQATADVVKDLEGSNSPVRVVPLEDAQVPGKPSSPNTAKYLLVGGLVGLLAGYTIALLRKLSDVRIRTSHEAEELTDAGVLGILPKTPSLKGQNRGEVEDDAASEAVRQLRTNLRFVSVDNPPRCVVVTSPNPGEGKSTVTTAIANSFAHAGEPTVIIDADLRRPTVAGVFGVDGSVGLTQVLSGQVSLQDALQQVPGSSLMVLPAGRIPPNPSELVGSQRMKHVLEDLRTDYMVFVDAPPVLPVTDASLLAAAADGAILVMEVGGTRKEQVELAASMLRRVSVTLLGCVLNLAPARGVGSSHYGFGYGGYRRGYSSYYGENKKSSRRFRSGSTKATKKRRQKSH